MLKKNLFQPLPLDKLKERTASIEIAYQLIAVTLVDGDILIGCLEKGFRWDGRVVSLGFNTAKGKRYGDSHVVEIPVNLIADIQPIPLSEASIPKVAPDDPSLALLRELGLEDEKYTRLPVQDYPNPLAKIICEHNSQIIAKHDLSVLIYVERALSEDAIPPEGIELDEDWLLYADWEFFSQQISGAFSVGTNIPIVGVSKDLSPSLQTEVIRRLRESWVDKIRKGTISNAIKEHLMQGRILVPQPPESTDIEGESWIVVICASSDDKSAEETYPVLLKLKSLRYPLEFLGHINSVLTFYGELLPIPLNVFGKMHKKTLLARAVGYLHKLEE